VRLREIRIGGFSMQTRNKKADAGLTTSTPIIPWYVHAGTSMAGRIEPLRHHRIFFFFFFLIFFFFFYRVTGREPKIAERIAKALPRGQRTGPPAA